MTTYTRRIILVVATTDQVAANLLAAGFDPDTGGDKTFGSIRLSPTGSEPPTHYGCSTPMTPETLAEVEALQPTGFPTGRIYRGYNDYDDEPDVTRYTFEDAIADMGLQRIGA